MNMRLSFLSALSSTETQKKSNFLRPIYKKARRQKKVDSYYVHPSQDIEEIISRGQKNLLNLREEEKSWNFHAHLGPHFIAQYSILLHWFGRKDSSLDLDVLKNILIETQLADGSWQQVLDANNTQRGEFNTTVFNYWALKVMKMPLDAPPMVRAKSYILKSGGLVNSALLTKIFLSLFDNHPWQDVPYTPYLLFIDGIPLNYKKFSQWVIPHLMAISYLRHNRVAKNLGKSFNLDELWIEKPLILNRPKVPKKYYDLPLLRKMMVDQQPHGSWGGYTISTLLTMMAFEHGGDHFPEVKKKLSAGIESGFHFVEDLYFKHEAGAYKGALMDGHYWDTILVANSLIESGVPKHELEKSAEYILTKQQKCGGFPYGKDFEYAPDMDDTAEALLLLSHWKEKYKPEIKRALDWITSKQNNSGGWAAFDKDIEGNFLLRRLTKKYQDSVDLFDSSCADVTGHMLEALGSLGMTKKNSAVIRKAVHYLKTSQDPITSNWFGRWGISYIYGTASAIIGLNRIGESAGEPYIYRALQWLMSKQNVDGGFGESTDSYLNPALAGKGVSTPSHTAWALMAFVSSGYANTNTSRRAARYLQEEFLRYGKWVDHSVVGTGHPGLLYMNYPAYPYVFPLLALSQYQKALKQKPHIQRRKKFVTRNRRLMRRVSL